ncbi:hypothetical protein ACFXTN_007242 [Malus domestica]
MKSCILCLFLVSMVVLNSEVKAERNRIHPGVLNPCKRPGGPHPGCNGDVKSPPQPANPYNRGCSMILRCRRGHDKVHNHKGNADIIMKLEAAEAKLQELQSSVAILGKEVGAARLLLRVNNKD